MPAEPDPSPPPATSRRNSALVGAGILASRVSGLVRERAMSHFLGTSFAADAFTAAFRIPNLLQHLLGEGVLSASFIPVYSRLLAEEREEEAAQVAGAIAGLLAVAAGVLALVGIVFAEPLTLLVAAGFRSRPETFELTVRLVRILFPAVGFLVLSAWCLGVLNSHRRFFLSYVAPVMLNVAQIAVLVGAGLTVFRAGFIGEGSAEQAQLGLVTWLAVGTVVGGLLQFAVQLPTVIRLSGAPRLSLRTDLPGVRQTLGAFGPIVGARGVVQISAYLQVFLASFLAVGALAVLRYAQILYLLPISLFGMAVAAAELPELSSADRDDRTEVVGRLRHGLTRIATFVVPTVLGYLVLGDLVVGALFQTGEFDRIDTVAVWIVLGGYAFGLLASTASRLLQSALYGGGDARTPARVAIARVIVASGLGVLLMFQLDRFGVTPDGVQLLGDLPAFGPLEQEARDAAGGGDLVRLGAAGLSVAAGVGAWLEFGLLRRTLRRDVGRFAPRWPDLRPIVLGCLAALAVAVGVRPLVGDLSPLLAGFLAVGATGGSYLAVAAGAGSAEIRSLVHATLRRLRP
ncbi:MAG: murein biosynthesis integral membrane protein MurJ [Egicoccus sp.]